MIAVKKIEPAPHTHQHSPRLESLLLDVSYKKNVSAINKKQVSEVMQSRIEAEYQLEKIFMCMF